MTNLRAWLEERSPEEVEHFLEETTRLWLEGGEIKKIYSLLSNYEFIEAKINHYKFGIQALIEDYRLLESQDCLDSLEYNIEIIKTLKLIPNALFRSGHIISTDKKQIAGQLSGRLLHFKERYYIRKLLQQISQTKTTCLRCLTANLPPPGTPLIRTLTGHSSSVMAVALTRDNIYVVSGSSYNTIKVWELATGKEIITLAGHSSSVIAVAISGDSQYVVSGSSDKIIKVWELTTGKEICSLIGHISSVSTIALSEDNKHIVSSSDDNTIKVWSLETGKEIRSLIGHSDSVNILALSWDNNYVVSASWDNTIKVWDLATGKEIQTFFGHKNWISTVAISGDNKYVVSGSWDNTIKVWDLATGKKFRTLFGHRNWISTVAISGDNKYVVSGSWDNTIKVWDLATGKEIRTLFSHTKWVNTLAISWDNNYIVSGSLDKTIKVWELTTEKKIHTISGHSVSVNNIALSNKNNYVVSRSRDSKIKMWNLATGEEITNNPSSMKSLNRYVVSIHLSDKIKVRDLVTGKEVTNLSHPRNWISTVAISGDNRYVVSGYRDNTIKVWDLAKRTIIYTLSAHKSSVNTVAISEDNKYVVSGHGDNKIKVWDLATGKEIATFTGENSITCCAITPSNDTIVAGDESGKVHFLRWEGREAIMKTKYLTTQYLTTYEIFSTVLNNFLHNYNHGYFTLVGFPGSGKTTILTQYAQSFPSLIYCNLKLTKKNTAQEFLPHLCHQLSQKFPFLSPIPQPITEGSWLLSQLLKKISNQLPASQKLIIAIDSLDAINPHSQPPGTNLLYLPRYLPQGIYFILARRPFKQDQSGLLIEAPSEILDLSQYEVKNWENEANYQEHWQKIQGEGLSDIARQVLQVLTSTNDEGFSLREIAKITQGDVFDIQELLDNWYEFLRLQRINQETRYSWYHPNFRDWLRDSFLRVG